VPDFKYRPTWNISAELVNTNVYQSMYVPYDDRLPYRVSITGNRFVMEFAKEPQKEADVYLDFFISKMMGNTQAIVANSVTVKKQSYGKIVPIDDDLRKAFITYATDKHDIYSLGRYATWRPSVLLDDVVKDVKFIQKMITHKSLYNIKQNLHKDTIR